MAFGNQWTGCGWSRGLLSKQNTGINNSVLILACSKPVFTQTPPNKARGTWSLLQERGFSTL